MSSLPPDAPTITAGILLRDVPPYRLGDALVEEATRRAGCRVGLYVIDLDGTELRRVAGPETLPERVVIPRAVGPELAAQSVEALRERIVALAGELTAVPLWLRHRAVAVLLAERPPIGDLEDLAREAAAAIELADGYTDLFAIGRRREATGPPSELQESLLPPRIAAAPGAELAGAILPAYDVGGDWIDHSVHAAGARLAIGDAVGKGARAAALSALAVAAQRSSRRAGASLTEVALAVHEVIARVGDTEYMTLVLVDWHAPDRMLTWLTCGHPPPVLAGADGTVEELSGHRTVPVGLSDLPPQLRVNQRPLAEGDRVLLYSDGISERRTARGIQFGLEGVRAALRGTERGGATQAVSAVQTAVIDAAPEGLRDDASLLALAVTADPGHEPAPPAAYVEMPGVRRTPA